SGRPLDRDDRGGDLVRDRLVVVHGEVAGQVDDVVVLEPRDGRRVVADREAVDERATGRDLLGVHDDAHAGQVPQDRGRVDLADDVRAGPVHAHERAAVRRGEGG